MHCLKNLEKHEKIITCKQNTKKGCKPVHKLVSVGQHRDGLRVQRAVGQRRRVVARKVVAGGAAFAGVYSGQIWRYNK